MQRFALARRSLIEARGECLGGHLRIGLRQRGEELFAAMRVGRAAINVKPIPDLQVLDITEISVEAGELVLLARGAVGAAFGEQPGGCGAVENLLAQKRRAAAIEAVGGGVFVDEALELQRVVAVACRFQRRREMADGDGAEPALGGSRLAGIVDDEGIDHRAARRAARQAGRTTTAPWPCPAAIRACRGCRDGSWRGCARSRAARDRRRRKRGAAAGRDRDSSTCGRARCRGPAGWRRSVCRGAQSAW